MKESNNEQLEKINFEEGKPNINQQEIFNSQHKSAEQNNISSDFINFVYGDSSAERLSGLIDKIVESDTKDLTERNINKKLAKLVLWHMVLLDILNLKQSDLDKSKPLTMAITDAVQLNSKNRLEFLSNKELNVNHVSNFLYEYSKSIFEELVDTSINRTKLSNKNDDQEKQLNSIKKIFCRFFEFSFCQMKKAAQLKPYKNDINLYQIYIEMFHNFQGRFYMCDPYYDCVHAETQDMASYLFATDKLQTFLSNYGTDFLYYFGWNCRGLNPWDRPCFAWFLFFLNELESIENRYRKDKDGFIGLFCPYNADLMSTKSGKDIVHDLGEARTVVTHIANILAYIEDETLFSEIRNSLIQRYKLTEKFVGYLDDETQKIKEAVRCCHGKCEHPQHQGNSIIDGTKNWFQEIIKRFAGNESIELITSDNPTQVINKQNGEFQLQVDNNEVSETDFSNLAKLLDYFFFQDTIFYSLMKSFKPRKFSSLDVQALRTLDSIYDTNENNKQITNYEIFDFLYKQIPIIYKNFSCSKVILFLKHVFLEFAKFVGHYLLIYPIVKLAQDGMLNRIVSTIGAILSCTSAVLFASALIFSWSLASCIALGIFFGVCFLINIKCSYESGKKLYAEDVKTAGYLTDFYRLEPKLKKYLETYRPVQPENNQSNLDKNKNAREENVPNKIVNINPLEAQRK